MLPVTIVTVRVRDGQGGVANYYRTLAGQRGFAERYYDVGGSGWRAARWWAPARVAVECAGLVRRIVGRGDRLVQLNPSLGWTALVRDGALLLAARVARRRVLVFWRGWDPALDARLRGPLALAFRLVFGRADGHLVLARRFGRRLRQLGCRGPIICETTIVPESLIDAPAGAADPGRDERPARLLFLARVERAKGIYTALDACAELQRRGRAVELLVAGDGSERAAAERYAVERKIGHVRFLGYVDGPIKDEVLRSADVYVFPSAHGEGMPNSVLEAMAAGLPVVATKAGALEDFFQHGRMGCALARPEPAELADCVERLLDDPDARDAIGQSNRRYVERLFAAPVVARRLERIYQFMLDGSDPSCQPPDWQDTEREAQPSGCRPPEVARG